MQKESYQSVGISQLQPGMFVVLDIGWLAHPFPTGKFKITQQSQIDTLRSLGLRSVQVDLTRSDVPGGSQDSGGGNGDGGAMAAAQAASRAAAQQLAAEVQARQALNRAERASLLAAQQSVLMACEKRFSETSRLYRRVADLSQSAPREAAEKCTAMVTAMVQDMMASQEIAIRLLSESAGEKSGLHPVNVMVLSVLLGRTMGLGETDLQALGVAAFLHDIGKQQVPERVRWPLDSFNSAETRLYQEHVAFGVQAARAMGLSPAAVEAIGQHHEANDGSGFPGRIRGEEFSTLGRLLSVVNLYDSLINPARASAALTPHEAVAALFSHYRLRCDPQVLSAFIRMVGIYPAGSVVQLSDERYALVVAVNSSRPLKPRVIVHEPRVPRHEALILDLEKSPELTIRRSLKPMALPSAPLEYLNPRVRVNYFFEGGMDMPLPQDTP
jgi:putative nucleotidyltransferase with HDIG domain